MSTQFSLRRLSKIVKALDALINETRDEINRSTSVSVNVQDEMDSIKSQVRGANMDFEFATDRFGELLSLRTTLRMAIGTANQVNGVNDLVTELQAVNTTLALYTHLKQRHSRDEKLSDENLDRRVEAAKATPVTEGRYSFAGRDDTLTVVTLGEDEVEWIQDHLSEAKFRSEAIVDQLERINTTISLELPDESVLALTQWQIIQDPDPVEPVKKIMDDMRADRIDPPSGLADAD